MLDETALTAMWQAGTLGFPGIPLSLAEFGTFVRARTTSAHGLHAADLFLACACALRVPGALETFEREFGRELDYTPRSGTTKLGSGDVGQMVRERLFVTTPERPAKILLYSGRAPLRHWLRAVVKRATFNALRKRVEEPTDDAKLMDAVADDNPEAMLIRGRLHSAYKSAFERAFRALSPAERTVLRLHYIDQLAIDALGRILGVHRATAARRLASTREKLRAQTQEQLCAIAGLSEAELSSAVRFIGDELDLSIERVFATHPFPDADAG
jgi:RNA polymerase sigma-70 factor (ECF subfamily)